MCYIKNNFIDDSSFDNNDFRHITSGGLRGSDKLTTLTSVLLEPAISVNTH